MSRREDGVPQYSVYQVLSGKDGWSVRRFVNGKVTVDALSFAATGPTVVAHVSLDDVTVTDPGADARYAGRSLAEAMRGVPAGGGTAVRLPAAPPAPVPTPTATPAAPVFRTAEPVPAAPASPPDLPPLTPAAAPPAAPPAPAAEVTAVLPAPAFGQRRYVIGAVPEDPPVGTVVSPAASVRSRDRNSRFRVAGGLKPPAARFKRWSPLERWQAAQKR